MYDEGAKTVDPDFHPRNARTLGTATRLSDSVAREKSAIEQELSTTNQLTEHLHMVLGTLEDKVHPVRADFPPSERDQAVRPMNGSSQVYNRIFENNETLVRAIERISRLTREVEV